MGLEADLEKTAHAGSRVATLDSASASDVEDVAPADEEEFQPPDGGLTAWSQVLAGCLVNMLAWGYPSTFGVYQLYYRDTLKVPEAQISWIGSLQTFLAFATCTFSGRLADAGFMKSTMAVGSFLTIFGSFMTSVATEYWQIFLAQGVCTGLGLGIIFMPPLAVINSYFKAKRSFALAIAATGTGIGSVVFPAVVQYLIPQIGFPWAVRCSAFVALFLAVAAILLLRPRLRPRKLGPLVEWEAFKEGPYVLYTLGSFLFFWALYFGFFYINAYARNFIGFSTTDSVQLLLITNGLSVPSRPLMGFLADRYMGPINTFTTATLFLGVMLFAWIGVDTRTGMYVFSVFFGLANGAAQGVFVGSLASLTKDPRKMGTRFGMVCTIVAFATLAGPPTAGAIIDKSGGSYLWAQVWAGLVIVLSSLVLAAARCAATGYKFKIKI
ncbi:major facilitator superfamily domain-containing protein [Lasiosphaeria miniovina]|uniref:Major facilitator superfamily domain-containing protein n=1 Tax=Lasiosphaeria miniovina TaxID=1954250 RepID=A0AA40B5J6_9PEZI|nr:major facilitator superfamily domain-containing protein [Lasiosphaeria miniovina]KAK0728052.1 major facilitator superfamily domain-containing protein [Lasiosphaeria miniovina]